METFCEKKSGKNLQGKNYRGGGSNNPLPLSCIRVKIATLTHKIHYLYLSNFQLSIACENYYNECAYGERTKWNKINKSNTAKLQRQQNMLVRVVL